MVLPQIGVIDIFPFLARDSIFGFADLTIVIEEAAVRDLDFVAAFVSINVVEIVRLWIKIAD